MDAQPKRRCLCHHDCSHRSVSAERTERRGVALLMVLMLLTALLVLGQMVMLLMDNVTKRSGTFRRVERGSYCAEEGLSLAKAWIAQNQAGGVLSPQILSGSTPAPSGVTSAPGSPHVPGTFPASAGLLADPTDNVDLANRDLCQIGTLGTSGINGLQGFCRIQPGGGSCATPHCYMYQINLVDDIDESPVAPSLVNPWVDHNGTVILRSECLWDDATQTSRSGLRTQDTDATVSGEYIQVPAAGS